MFQPTPARMPFSTTAAIVNHGTPHLTRMAVWSLRSAYPDLPILVVDSGSPDDSIEQLRRLADEAGHCTLIEARRNIHHGPGLDLAIRQMTTEWALTFDSDCILYRSGLLEAMLEHAERNDAYMTGDLVTVDEWGHRVSKTSDTLAHPYVHPRCALVRRATYLKLPPFEKHGAPCLRNAIAAAGEGHTLIHFPVGDYVYHAGRGTVSRYGYGLGVKGQIQKLRRRLRL